MNPKKSLEEQLKEIEAASSETSKEIIARLSPQDTIFYCSLGIGLSEKGDYEGAIEAYRTALKLTPRQHMIHHLLGVALLTKAIPPDWFDLSISSDKIVPPQSFSREQTGLLEEARKEFYQSIELYPDFPDSYTYLGMVLGIEGKKKQAAEQFRIALTLDPEYESPYTKVAEIRLKQLKQRK